MTDSQSLTLITKPLRPLGSNIRSGKKLFITCSHQAAMLSYIIKMYSDRKRENIFYSGHKDEKKMWNIGSLMMQHSAGRSYVVDQSISMVQSIRQFLLIDISWSYVLDCKELSSSYLLWTKFEILWLLLKNPPSIYHTNFKQLHKIFVGNTKYNL